MLVNPNTPFPGPSSMSSRFGDGLFFSPSDLLVPSAPAVPAPADSSSNFDWTKIGTTFLQTVGQIGVAALQPGQQSAQPGVQPIYTVPPATVYPNSSRPVGTVGAPMTKNQKLLIGVGVAAAALFLVKRKGR